MNVFVILMHAMGGVQDIAVFSTLSEALNYKTSFQLAGEIEVVERTVNGDLESPGTVFTASELDQSYDIHNFIGVYGSFDRAKKDAGAKGSVLNREIDPVHDRI